MDIAKIRQKAEELAPEITELRHHLHANPELSWQEVNTSKLIESELKKLGFDNIKRGFDGTECGVTADLTGDPSGPVIALRADIDALPLPEEGLCSYKSTNGAMHACGHDGHAACLIGVARLLASIKNDIPGTIRFLFQPAEEHGKRSGALALIREGALDGVRAVGGMHLWSTVPVGRVVWKYGPAMAAVDSFNFTFTGKGGHGAMPHQAIDPTPAAASFISALQTVVSREIDPAETAVISIGQLQSGNAFNIIPETATITGNTRSFSDDVHNELAEKMTRLAEGIAAAYRCTVEKDIVVLYPSVINHVGATDVLRKSAVSALGEENVKEAGTYMVSEDFSYYQRKVPGVFYFMGCGAEETKTNYPHHSPNFNIDDRVIPDALTVMSAFALNLLTDIRSGAFKA